MVDPWLIHGKSMVPWLMHGCRMVDAWCPAGQGGAATQLGDGGPAVPVAGAVAGLRPRGRKHQLRGGARFAAPVPMTACTVVPADRAPRGFAAVIETRAWHLGPMLLEQPP